MSQPTMRRKRGIFSYSPFLPWWQNSSSETQGTAYASASGSVGNGHQFTTVVVTETRYTIVPFSTLQSSRHEASGTHSSSKSSRSSSSGTSIPHSSSLRASDASATRPSTSSESILYSTKTVSTTEQRTHTVTVLSPLATSSESRIISNIVVTDSKTSSITTATSSSASAAAAAGATAGNHNNGGFISSEPVSQHAASIAGGITGSFAGVALLGVLLLFLLRRRKKREYPLEKRGIIYQRRVSSSSQALPSHNHSNSTTVSTRQPTHPPVIDHNLIHMDVEHWHRPYAHGDPQAQQPHSPLRLMNPDPTPTPPTNRTTNTSLPMTETAPAVPPHRFLERQRSALFAALLTVKRSFSQDVDSSNKDKQTSNLHDFFPPPKGQGVPQQQQQAHPPPTRLTLPSELILSPPKHTLSPTPEESPRADSFHSPATSNQTIIRHQPPYDPFTTSPTASPSPTSRVSITPSLTSSFAMSPTPSGAHTYQGFLAPPPLAIRAKVVGKAVEKKLPTPSPLQDRDGASQFIPQRRMDWPLQPGMGGVVQQLQPQAQTHEEPQQPKRELPTQTESQQHAKLTIPIQSYQRRQSYQKPQKQAQQPISPISRTPTPSSNSSTTTQFEERTRAGKGSEVSSLQSISGGSLRSLRSLRSTRSGPFDLATESVVGDDGVTRDGVGRDARDGREETSGRETRRGVRGETPNWEVHVYPGT